MKIYDPEYMTGQVHVAASPFVEAMADMALSVEKVPYAFQYN